MKWFVCCAAAAAACDADGAASSKLNVVVDAGECVVGDGSGDGPVTCTAIA